MLTNAPELGAKPFGCGEYLLHWRCLASTGARIYEWAHGPSIHAKLMLVDDDLSVVGSYNLDLRSTYLDTELMRVVKSRVQTALRVLCIRAKMALSRTSGILLAPFRYLM